MATLAAVASPAASFIVELRLLICSSTPLLFFNPGVSTSLIVVVFVVFLALVQFVSDSAVAFVLLGGALVAALLAELLGPSLLHVSVSPISLIVAVALNMRLLLIVAIRPSLTVLVTCIWLVTSSGVTLVGTLLGTPAPPQVPRLSTCIFRAVIAPSISSAIILVSKLLRIVTSSCYVVVVSTLEPVLCVTSSEFPLLIKTRQFVTPSIMVLGTLVLVKLKNPDWN